MINLITINHIWHYALKKNLTFMTQSGYITKKKSHSIITLIVGKFSLCRYKSPSSSTLIEATCCCSYPISFFFNLRWIGELPCTSRTLKPRADGISPGVWISVSDSNSSIITMSVGSANSGEKKNNQQILAKFDIRNLNCILWCTIKFTHHLKLLVQVRSMIKV